MPREHLDTFEKRRHRFEKLVNDDKLDLSPAEVLIHGYHWLLFEYYCVKASKLRRKMIKQKKWLEDTEKVYSLRRQLHDL